jgi:hypothetical protein
MSPLIEAHDTVIAESVRPQDLRRGALIVFRDGASLVVHRIIRKKAKDGCGLLCQMGDNGSAYSWVPETDVVGRVLAIEKGRHLIPLGGPMAVLAGSGIRLLGSLFIQSEDFVHGLQKNLGGETPGLVLRWIRRLTAAAHHLACRSVSAGFLWARRKSGLS